MGSEEQLGVPMIFTVYFPKDESWVGAQGMDLLRQAVQMWEVKGRPAVEVTGHVDSSYPQEIRQPLSERRAQHVAHILRSMGIPDEFLHVSGRGDNEKAVPTADGVAEPRNRRVSIYIGH